MTPEEAAAVLGIAPDASPTEIDRAYRQLARELHPDRFVGRPSAEAEAASERFILAARAHETLAQAARWREHAPPEAAPGPAGRPREYETPPEPTGRPREHEAPETTPEPTVRAAASAAMVTAFSWPLFLTWALLLTVGAALSFSSGPVASWVDWWPRLVLLEGFALATALTGRKWVWVTTLVLLGVTAVMTVIDTTEVGLLGLGCMLIASFGLAVQGRLVRLPD
jgi:hypothetical protein